MHKPGPLKKQLGSPALFGIVQGFIAASIYFSTGLVAERALGLTWAVFLAGGVLFAFIVPVYVEGASLHQERGGDRDAAAPARERRLAVRQDARDRAGRAPVPGHHRVLAVRAPAPGADPVKLLRGYVLPALMILIGVGLIVRTILGGGGPIAFGLIIGVLFILAGVGRIYVERGLR